jgi:DNA-nicking Smr family endonuclease
VRSITPLRRAKRQAEPQAADGAPAPTPARAPAPAPAPPPGELRAVTRTGGAAGAKALPLAPLGRRFKQRVARGRAPIDARIDLHGLTQKQAHAALLQFFRGAQADGARIVLIVTGKGTARAGSDSECGRGVLRRQVPIWLSLPEFRAFITGFEDAHVGHGGEGALYVRLRRGR